MKKFPVMLLVLAAAVSASTVSASHDSPLYEATDRYRDAVVHFERHVIQARTFDRYDVRLVDDLEDSTSRLRSAARHAYRSADHDYRFASAMRAVTKLHSRVEQAICGEPSFHQHPELAGCWQAVTHAFAAVINEANCLAQHRHIHVQETWHRVPNYAPQVVVPTIIVPAPIAPTPIVPQSRSVNYQQRIFDHHAGVQARVGAMLQRR